MAWLGLLLQQAGRVPWGRVWDAGVVGYGWVSSAASRSYATAAALPTECKQASVHAGLACAGFPADSRVIPCFGPFPLGWGWLVTGILVGALLTTVVFLSRQRGWGHGRPQTRADQERHNLLDHIRAHGRLALQEFANLANTTEVEMLFRIVGIQPPAQRPPGLGAANGLAPTALGHM